MDVRSSRHSILLLGFNFLNNFGLLIDCQQKTIIDPKTLCSKKLKTFNDSINLVVNNNMPELIKGLIKRYPNIISPHTNPVSTYTGVDHRIDTGSHAPTFA